MANSALRPATTADFTICDVENVCREVFDRAMSLDEPLKTSELELVNVFLNPLLIWLKALGDALSFCSYSSGGYSCVGFVVGSAVVRGVPVWGDNLLNRSKWLKAMIMFATGADPQVVSLSSLAATAVRDVQLDLRVLHLCPRGPANAKSVGDRGRALAWLTAVSGTVLPWRSVAAMTKLLVERNVARGEPQAEVSSAATLLEDFLATPSELADYWTIAPEANSPMPAATYRTLDPAAASPISSVADCPRGFRMIRGGCFHTDRKILGVDCEFCHLPQEMCLACMHSCVNCAGVSRREHHDPGLSVVSHRSDQQRS